MSALPEVNAGATARLTITLTDYAGTSVPLASLSTLTLSVYDEDTDTACNGIDGTNIKNANGGTITDGGGYVDIAAATNAMVSTTAEVETHVALVKFTTTGGLAGNDSLRFNVRRVRS